MFEIPSFLLIIAAIALQYILSSRNNAYLGAIVPILATAYLSWMYVTDRIENLLAFMLILLVMLLFLLEEWSQGRKKHHRERQRELDKMRTHDI